MVITISERSGSMVQDVRRSGMTFKNVSKQKFDAIMSKAISLDLCPHCGGPAEIVVRIPWYGQTGAKVQCSHCGYSTRIFDIHSTFHCDETKSLGTPILEKSIMVGIRAAIQSWNCSNKKKGR